MDELIDVWGANFIRLLLENYPDDQGGAVQWQNVLDDPDYLQDVIELVDYATQKPGVYVLLSLWVDAAHSSDGWPTAGTIAQWELLAETFRDHSRVLFGLVNEPEGNWDGSLDADCWEAMNDTVAAIRAVEDGFGTPHHVVAVQGTREWARRLDYYVDHPITAGGGENVVYEAHVYDPASDFQTLFIGPSQTLPVIIGEFGPAEGYMTLADCETLMDEATARDIPHLAWTFHMRCSPDLLVDTSSGGCGEGMSLEPTEWGSALQARLGAAW
jgi:endoglucanase